MTSSARDRTPTAAAAGRPQGVALWPRFAAAACDWVVASMGAWLGAVVALVVAALFDLGDGVQTALVWLLPAAGAAAYFAGFLATGRTLGMRANGLRVLAVQDGEQPSRRRATARGAAAGVSGAAWLLVIAFVSSETPDGGYSTTEVAVTLGAAVVALLALLGHFTQVADPSRRCLQDRLFGLAVVDERDIRAWRAAA